MDGFRVGEVARQAQVNVQTIHYYERRGLLPSPRRTESNYRVYSEDAVRTVRFIKHAQELGFTLREIRELLALKAAPNTECGDVRQRAEVKLKDIEEKLRSLESMRAALTRLISKCSGNGPAAACSILEALDSEE